MKDMQETLQWVINKDYVDNRDDVVIKTALNLYANAKNSHDARDTKNKIIKEWIKNSFDMNNISKSKSFKSNIMHNVLFKFTEQMRPLDYKLICEWNDLDTIETQKSWLNYILEMSWFMKALQDKWWVFENILSYWDGFMSVSNFTERKKWEVLKFRSTDAWRIYVDPFANKMRSPSSENDVDECLVLYNYSWDEFIQIYPNAEKIATSGDLPLWTETDKIDYTDTQDSEITERNVQVGHYYNRSKKVYTVFAWAWCTKLQEYRDAKYPFIKNKGKFNEESYIPLLHFMCFPSSEWFYNHWVWEKVYQIWQLQEEVKNNGYKAMRRNINSPSIYNIANWTADEFFAQLEQVEALNEIWEDWFIVNEMQAWDNASKANVEWMSAPSITQDYQIMLEDLEKELNDMWISLQGTNTDSWKTARALLIEEENKEKTIVSIMEQNTSEWQFAIELVLEYIKKIPSSDNTPVVLTNEVTMEDGTKQDINEVLDEAVTLWDIADEFRKNQYRVVIDSRSWTYQSKVSQAIRLQQMINLTAWDPEAQKKLVNKMWKLYNLDMWESKQQQPQEAQQWWGAKNIDMQPIVDWEMVV